MMSIASAIDTTTPGHSALDTAERELIRLWDEAKMDSLMVMFRPYATVNPEHPITKFLNATLEQDGQIAANGFIDLVDAGYPVITPRAMLRLSQYYRSVGDSLKASKVARRLKSEYPEFCKRDYQIQRSRNAEYLYTLQLGAFRNLENAQKLNDKISGCGMSSHIMRKSVNGHMLYLVWAGEYATQTAADHTGQRLANNYRLEYIIIPRSLHENND